MYVVVVVLMNGKAHIVRDDISTQVNVSISYCGFIAYAFRHCWLQI